MLPSSIQTVPAKLARPGFTNCTTTSFFPLPVNHTRTINNNVPACAGKIIMADNNTAGAILSGLHELR